MKAPNQLRPRSSDGDHRDRRSQASAPDPGPRNPDPGLTDVDFASITPELLSAYDRPGPRYTSYPTAPQFSTAFGREHYERALDRAAERAGEPLSLYVHIPFCEARCTYCGCSVVISPRRGPEVRYLDAVDRELELVAGRLDTRRSLGQLHWGGGTPTYLTPEQCERLFDSITRRFTLAEGAEVSVEVDPCVTTEAHLATLRRLGFNRISMGVQDFDPQVQHAVRRVQSLELTQRLVAASRRLGFQSVNIDLIYGLPYQTVEEFARSVDRAIEAISPDRVAVFSYAHVPWIKPHQKTLEGMPLPRGWEKFRIFVAAAERFLSAGYRFIGMDHFAKPGDELTRALETGVLHRNFMGYTVMPATDQIGVGITSIGDVAGAYVQNEKNLARYERTVSEGRLPVERGLRRSEEDDMRGAVIRRLICTFRLEFAWVRKRFGIEPTEVFAREIGTLGPLVADGLVAIDEAGVRVLPRGRFFIRNICMPFDAYLPRDTGKQLYSRTV
jgi:oxygen-independent coproporphyrinogen-3 oxidase